MSTDEPPANRTRPSALLSIAIFLTATALMCWLKLRLFPERYVALAYALPLLVCLWHKDRRLLWAMALTFGALGALKALVMLPGPYHSERFELLQWLMQLTNLAVVAATVQTILNLTDRLRARNAELRTANHQLTARGEEIVRQNAELQAQAEELGRQNEELQQQGEELGCQNEELHQQAEELERQAEELRLQAVELQAVNEELNQRENMLQKLLGCLAGAQDERQMMAQVCQALIELIGEPGTVAMVPGAGRG